MKLRKSFLMILLSILLFMAVGCSNQKQEDKNDGNNNDKEPKTEENGKQDVFIPRVEIPSNLPVYPVAYLINDAAMGGDGHWAWLYATDASANEIVAFFSQTFLDLGYELDEDFTFAMYEEFFIVTKSLELQVFWLDDGISEANPDTPNRWYAILVNLEAW